MNVPSSAAGDTDDGDEDDGVQVPLLPVASRGGPFDDVSYGAGYEMGKMEAELAFSERTRAVELTVHAGNRAQADLIAMCHDWMVVREVAAGEHPPRVTLTLRPTAPLALRT